MFRDKRATPGRAVHADRFDWAEVFSRPTVFSGEGHIMPNVSGGAARFQSTDEVALCQEAVKPYRRELCSDKS
jgi:hypothetical protein